MFTKIDKRILIVTIILLILVLAIVFVSYKYRVLVKNVTKVEVPADQKVNIGTNNNIEQKPEVQLQNNSVKAEGTTSKGTLTVCLDKCGDGICQKTDPNCKNGDLSCICLETKSECPQDCPGN